MKITFDPVKRAGTLSERGLISKMLPKSF